MAYEGEIRNLITMREFCDRYMIHVEKDKILCPFHNDSSPSCYIYPGNKGFYCFSCGTGGDVLNFAKQWYGLGTREAMQRLNSEFALNLPLDEYADRDKIRDAEKKRQEEREQKAKKEAELSRRYWDLFDVLQGIEMVIDAYRPLAPDIPAPKRFTDALERREEILYALDCAEIEKRKFTDNDYQRRFVECVV